jgi:hypothetical protein
MIDGLAYADQRVTERKRRAAYRRARRKRDRAELDARRRAGLKRRHARKTGRA